MEPLCLNTAFDGLPTYPFPRVRALLDPHTPPPGDVFNLTIGAPRHAPPPFVMDILARNSAKFGAYPPIEGSPELKAAIAGWIGRRYGANMPPAQILPLVGTREGLYMLSDIAMNAGAGRKRIVMPNPLYPAYSAAALSAGAVPTYLNATQETGFLPDLSQMSDAMWAETALIYLCSPSNPQGMAASADYLRDALARARRYGALLAVDECYADIWLRAAPVGGLEIAGGAAPAGDPFSHLVVIHSLSKRSNLPGLRSGFIAGDARVIAAFQKLRSYGGPTMPLPHQSVSAACWNDDDHVEANRRLYLEKFNLAEQILGISPPDGGFFLWLRVDTPEEDAAVALWRDFGVRTIPGTYLATQGLDGSNPGAGYIRAALVEGPDETRTALERLAAAPCLTQSLRANQGDAAARAI